MFYKVTYLAASCLFLLEFLFLFTRRVADSCVKELKNSLKERRVRWSCFDLEVLGITDP